MAKAQRVDREIAGAKREPQQVNLRLIEERPLWGRMIPHEWDPVEEKWGWCFDTFPKKVSEKKEKRKGRKLRKRTIDKLRRMLKA